MPSKPVTLATALLATSALGLTGVEIAANRAADAALRHAIATHAGLRVGGIEASPLRGQVIVRDIAMGDGAVRVTIGALTLPAPMPSLGLITSAQASPFDDKPDETPSAAAPTTTPSPVPSAASMGNASASNVVITNGSTTYRIKRIDLTGTMLSVSDVATLLDAKTADALASHLKTLSAAAIVIPEITSDDPTTGSERHWTVKQVLLANVVAGKVANGSAGGMNLHDERRQRRCRWRVRVDCHGRVRSRTGCPCVWDVANRRCRTDPPALRPRNGRYESKSPIPHATPASPSHR